MKDVIFDKPKGVVEYGSPKAKYFVIVMLSGEIADSNQVETKKDGSLLTEWFDSPHDPTWAFENYWDAYAYRTRVMAGLIKRERNEKIRNLKAAKAGQDSVGTR